MSVSVQVLRRNNALIGWLAFVSQVLVAISVEIGDEFGRALFATRDGGGVDNARRIVALRWHMASSWSRPGRCSSNARITS
jgi:hypothetical protein